MSEMCVVVGQVGGGLKLWECSQFEEAKQACQTAVAELVGQQEQVISEHMKAPITSQGMLQVQAEMQRFMLFQQFAPSICPAQIGQPWIIDVPDVDPPIQTQSETLV